MAIYALCVWPANFKHAIDGVQLPYISDSWLYHGHRLAMQPVIMWWASIVLTLSIGLGGEGRRPDGGEYI